MIKIAVPNKGRLHEPTIKLLDRSGINITNLGDRKLFANTLDPEIQILFIRANDIPQFVNNGVADLGITGKDMVFEYNDDVELLLDLDYGKARLIVASPENSPIRSVSDVKDGTKVATEFPNLTKKFFEENGKHIKIVKVSGATEIAPQIGVADMIVDLTDSGTTLKVNKLIIIEEILASSVHLIANKDSLKNKGKKIQEIQTALLSVLKAGKKKLIMMNVPKEAIDGIRKVMPGMAGPTISEVASDIPMLAVNVVVNERDVHSLINNAKNLGARDILVLPIERIIE